MGDFMRNTVSMHPDWKVQEILAMAFDLHCKAVGNALKDISKKFPSIVSDEISTWDLLSKRIRQVHELASKYLFH